MIEIADNLSLDPAAFAMQRSAVVATSGGGKTYACGRIVEQFSAANVPVVVFDTTGVWAAIRLAADGTSPGLPFTVIGGAHADLPLPEGKAGPLARFLVATNASVVVDLSMESPRARAPFLTEFFEAFLPALVGSRRPRVVVLDEAQDVAPEKARGWQQDLVFATSAFVRKARNHLCGVIQVTQRPESVNKEVLNLSQNLLVDMLHGSHERKAVAGWLDDRKLTGELAAQFRETRQYQPGEFLFCSPSWMRTHVKVRVLPKWTFDGSGEKRIGQDVDLSEIAPVDFSELRGLFEGPPKAEAAPSPPPDGSRPTLPTPVAVAAVRDAERKVRRSKAELDWTASQLEAALRRVEALEAFVSRVTVAARELSARCLEVPPPWQPAPPPTKAELDVAEGLDAPAEASEVLPPARPAKGSLARRHEPGAELAREGEANRRAAAVPSSDYRGELLAVLALRGPMGRLELALLAGVSPTSSTYDGALAALLREGLAEKTGRGEYRATARGARNAGHPTRHPGDELRAYWKARMPPNRWKMIEVAAAEGRVARNRIAELAGQGRRSSTVDVHVSKLKRLGIFAAGDGQLWLSDAAKRAFGWR